MVSRIWYTPYSSSYVPKTGEQDTAASNHSSHTQRIIAQPSSKWSYRQLILLRVDDSFFAFSFSPTLAAMFCDMAFTLTIHPPSINIGPCYSPTLTDMNVRIQSPHHRTFWSSLLQ